MITGNQPAQKEQVMPDKLHSFINRVTMKAVDNCIILAVYEALYKYHLIIKITLCERVNYPDFIDKKTGAKQD